MSNPIYNAMGKKYPANGNQAVEVFKQFNQFRIQMQGKNPTEEIQKLLQSGKISQQQLNQAQQMAMQMQNVFKNFIK